MIRLERRKTKGGEKRVLLKLGLCLLLPNRNTVLRVLGEGEKASKGGYSRLIP